MEESRGRPVVGRGTVLGVTGTPKTASLYPCAFQSNYGPQEVLGHSTPPGAASLVGCRLVSPAQGLPAHGPGSPIWKCGSLTASWTSVELDPSKHHPGSLFPGTFSPVSKSPDNSEMQPGLEPWTRRLPFLPLLPSSPRAAGPPSAPQPHP